MANKKVHHLNRIVLEFPEDCGKGIAFWVNQQVGTFLDSLSLRWHDTEYPGTYDFPNKKASDCAKGGFYVQENGEWVTLPCGHNEWKNTGKVYKTFYSLGDCFALTELDKFQSTFSIGSEEMQTIINGYMDNLCNLLSVSGIHIKATMEFQSYTVIPANNVKDCSYRDNGKHKAVTIKFKEKYRLYNYVEIGSVSREINAPVPVAIAA